MRAPQAFAAGEPFFKRALPERRFPGRDDERERFRFAGRADLTRDRPPRER